MSGIHSFRGERGIPFESTLERDFLIRTGFRLDVSEIIAQPIQIPFRTSTGGDVTYTPDFLVIYRPEDPAHPEHRKPNLVEVKPERDWRRHRERWAVRPIQKSPPGWAGGSGAGEAGRGLPGRGACWLRRRPFRGRGGTFGRCGNACGG